MMTVGCLLAAGTEAGMATSLPEAAETTSSWHGFARYHITVAGRAGYLVSPKRPAPGKPWVWRARFPDYHSEIDVGLLRQGFHVGYLDVAGCYGSDRAMAAWDRFYEVVTTRFGLSPLPALEAVSRGALTAYRWAKRHPDWIACIYADSPVLDIRSWPGGKGRGRGSREDWQALLQAYGITEAAAADYSDNPVDGLESLAAAGVPLMHVIGLNDQVVPPAENTAILAQRYRAFGGTIEVVENKRGKEELFGHHFVLDEPLRGIDFIINYTGLPPVAPGRQYHALRGGLANCRARFVHDKHGRVVFLGGSITHNPGWQNLVAADLRRRFPETTFEFINAGIPSTGSTPGAFRLARDVLAGGRVDLLFEEAAVNDRANGRTALEQVRGMEGIVRHTRLVSPETDIVLLHFAAPWHTQDYAAGRVPEVIASHEQVAEYYGVPSVNLAREVAERLAAGQFSWQRDFRNLHPSPFGQRLYFQAVKRLLDAAWRGAPAAAVAPPSKPPAPMDPQSYMAGQLLGIDRATALNGFRVEPRWHPRLKAGTRPGFVNVPMLVADKPGASLELEFEGRGVGIFVAAGPDAGTIDYRIDDGPERQLDTFTKWSAGLYIPWAYVLDADLPAGRHCLRLVLSEVKPLKSRGTALRIRHFLVNGPTP